MYLLIIRCSRIIINIVFLLADNDVFLAGSTSKHIYVLDRRLHSSGGLAMLLTGDAKVGALVVSRSGNSCLSGDSHGAMKLWDLRTKACVETVYNEDGHKPITSLSTSSGSHGNNISFQYSLANIAIYLEFASKILSLSWVFWLPVFGFL